MTVVEFRFDPHPVGLKANIPVRTWTRTYRWRWWAHVVAIFSSGPVGRGALGYVSARVHPE